MTRRVFSLKGGVGRLDGGAADQFSGEQMGKKIIREEIEIAVMQYLNKIDDWSTHFYDCGQNGILHIRWGHHKWEKSWVEIESLPLAMALCSLLTRTETDND